MQFRETNHYAYPAEVVLKVFSDKDYFLEKYARAGATSIQLLENDQGEHTSRITISRDVDVDIPIPAFARKHVPHTITVIQSDNWNRQTQAGFLDIRFKGMPADIRCRMRVDEANGQTTLQLDFTVRVNIPLVGSRLAEVLGRDLRAKFDKDSTAAKSAMDLIATRYL